MHSLLFFQFGLERARNNRIVKKVPKGTSEYQSSWILEDGDEHDENDDGSEEGSTGDMMEDEMIADMKDDSEEETVCIVFVFDILKFRQFWTFS